MIRAAIIYFSGTGNTKFVACNMKKKLEEKNIYTDLINIEEDTVLPCNYKYIVIGVLYMLIYIQIY